MGLGEEGWRSQKKARSLSFRVFLRTLNPLPSSAKKTPGDKNEEPPLLGGRNLTEATLKRHRHQAEKHPRGLKTLNMKTFASPLAECLRRCEARLIRL